MSQVNLDPYGDMLETFAWGIAWQLGYFKHPPLMAWIAAGWFELFPRTNFFFYLLASFNVEATVLVMAAIATRYLSPRQITIAVVAAQLLPPLTFLGLTYNANSAMLPIWALSFLFYLRVLERRRLVDAAVLGLLLGLAMLAKYHSAVLVLALAIHVLADREVRPLLATPLPWISSAVALLVFAPHVIWLFGHDFWPVRFAATGQGGGGIGAHAYYAGEFVVSFIGYSLPGLAVVGLFRNFSDGGPLMDWQAVARLRGSVEGRALLAVAFLPFLLTMVLALAIAANLTSTWEIPFFFCIPILLTLLLPERIAERRAGRAPMVVTGIAALLFVAAPS